MSEPEQLYSTQQVAQACGVSFRQLDHWIRRGYVKVEHQAEGSGTKRRFTTGEAMQVLLTAKLSNIGVRPGTVSPANMDVGYWPPVANARAAAIKWDHEVLAQELSTTLGVDEHAG